MLRSDLDEALDALGWSYRLFDDIAAFRLDSGKHIRSCDVLAWDEALELAGEVDEAIRNRDQAALDRLYQQDFIGSVAIDHDMPFVADEEMLNELRTGAVERSIVERIAQANQFYSVRTSAGRNDFSLQLQDVVGNLLGIALYGVLEDPQEGTYENFARELVEGADHDLSESSPARKKPWWQFW